MLAYVIPLCMAVLGIAAVLNVVRLIQGPDMPDRVLALDTLYINALALIVLFGIWLASDLFFEAALLIAVDRDDLAIGANRAARRAFGLEKIGRAHV